MVDRECHPHCGDDTGGRGFRIHLELQKEPESHRALFFGLFVSFKPFLWHIGRPTRRGSLVAFVLPRGGGDPPVYPACCGRLFIMLNLQQVQPT